MVSANIYNAYAPQPSLRVRPKVFDHCCPVHSSPLECLTPPVSAPGRDPLRYASSSRGIYSIYSIVMLPE